MYVYTYIYIHMYEAPKRHKPSTKSGVASPASAGSERAHALYIIILPSNYKLICIITVTAVYNVQVVYN